MSVTLRQILNDNPEFMDYTICLSQVFIYDPAKEGEEQIIAVTDFPIMGLGSNPEESELRFVISSKDHKDLLAAKQTIIRTLDQKLAEKRDGESPEGGVNGQFEF